MTLIYEVFASAVCLGRKSSNACTGFTFKNAATDLQKIEACTVNVALPQMAHKLDLSFKQEVRAYCSNIHILCSCVLLGLTSLYTSLNTIQPHYIHLSGPTE